MGIRLKVRLAAWWRKRWVRTTTLVLSVPLAVSLVVAAYYYNRFARLIDDRLHGERQTVLPRVFARPLELRRGLSLTERQLVDRLNDLGYAQRITLDKPGEFAVGNGFVAIVPRGTEVKAQVVRGVLQPTAPDGRH